MYHKTYICIYHICIYIYVSSNFLYYRPNSDWSLQINLTYINYNLQSVLVTSKYLLSLV